MNEWLDKLNLQPHEKRVVVIVVTILFLVLNYLFVWPRLGSVQEITKKRDEAASLRDLRASHAKQTNSIATRVNNLKKTGETILKQDQNSQFLSTLQIEAGKAGLNIMQTRNLGNSSFGQTNGFVEERAISITFTAGDSNLVDFMYAMSQPGSILRVQTFDLGPEAPAQTRLSGTMTLIGSIETAPKAKPDKSASPPAAKTGASTNKTSAATAKPSTPTVTGAKPPAPATKPSGVATNSIPKKK